MKHNSYVITSTKVICFSRLLLYYFSGRQIFTTQSFSGTPVHRLLRHNFAGLLESGEGPLDDIGKHHSLVNLKLANRFLRLLSHESL